MIQARRTVLLVVLGLAGHAACAANDDEEATPYAGGHEAADGSPTDDAAPSPCNHRRECAAEGESCTSDCGQPCTCILVTPSYRGWDCPRPVTGTLCDPIEHQRCDYPPDDNADTVTCTCEAPDGDYFWRCGGVLTGESACPVDEPGDGASCTSLPAGLTCRYESETGITQGCRCTNVDASKIWECT